MKAYKPDKDAKDTQSYWSHEEWRTFVATPEQSITRLLHQEVNGHLVALATAQALWQKTKGVYRFDETLSKSLLSMNAEKMAVGLLARLPEWCVYLEVNKSFPEIHYHGTFVATFPLEREGAIGAIMTHIITRPDTPGGQYTFASNFITGLSDAKSSFLDAQGAGREYLEISGISNSYDKDAWKDELDAIAWAYTFYICSSEAEIHNRQDLKLRPTKKRNNGPVRHWEVGYRFGAAFRKQLAEAEKRAGAGYAGDERNRPRVHVRRAHWHSFWTGPMDGERKRVVKWLPPVIVNGDSNDLPATIWRQA